MPDSGFMRLALLRAAEAAAAGEIPVGAAAVVNGEAVASARNRVEERRSVTAHAEIELLHALEQLRGDWRMEDVTVYVTKEPCPMCAGALVNARVRRIVYGVPDPRSGGCTVFGITSRPDSLWRPETLGGVCADEAGALLSEFFRSARAGKKRLPLRTRNSHDPQYAAALNALMREAFGFDFDYWFRLGMWNGKYESSAIFDGGRMIAHAGLIRMKLRVAGEERRAIQINGVACTRDERGRGHVRRLLDGILRRYSGTPAYLFANDSVLGFYPKFGFVPAAMKLPVADEAVDNPVPPVRALPGELRELAAKRRIPSALFSVNDDFEVRCFHLYGEFADRLYRLAPGIAAAAEAEGDTLKLHELFSDRPVRWETLAPLLPFRGIRRVEFGFCPDRLGINFRWEEPAEPENLFLHGPWRLPENFLIPEFSRT
ncbi:MAG: GNAT family N-acetyltransferase [Lentisphaeria bacterium]|nr:GNAT family N-acetyltransferase [Lentisphaeria bacterium]